jgi:endonuclease YncB( thermonuclease family)
MLQPKKYKWTVHIGSWSLTQWMKYLLLVGAVILAARYIGGGTHPPSAITDPDQHGGIIADRELACQVVHVVDGDTLDLAHDGSKVRVRLFGIDCPEMAQAYGDAARRFTDDACLDKRVILKDHGKDKYGRVLGDVILGDGEVLNRELVKAGLAWWYAKYSDDRELEELEQEARRSRIGLWADSSPISPWDFRARH